MVAYNSTKVYLEACKNAGKTASIIYIGTYHSADSITAGEQFQALLDSEFAQFEDAIDLYSSYLGADTPYIHFYTSL